MLKKNVLALVIGLFVLCVSLVVYLVVAYTSGNKMMFGLIWYNWFFLLGIPASVIITILALNYYFCRQLSILKKWLYSLKENMAGDVPIMYGKFGEIADLVNKFTIDLSNTKTIIEHLVESLPLAVVGVDCEGKVIISSQNTGQVLNCNSIKAGKYCNYLLNPRSPLYLLQRTLRYDKTLKDCNYTVYFPGGHRHISVFTNLIKDYDQKTGSTFNCMGHYRACSYGRTSSPGGEIFLNRAVGSRSCS